MPPAFALSQDQTLRFISPPTPESTSQAIPANPHPQPIHSIATQPPQPNHQTQTPQQQHPPQTGRNPPSSAARASHSPSPSHKNRSRTDTPAKARPSHPNKDNQTATHPLNALPKPDAVFNEQLPCGRPEACRPGPTGTRPCRVGSSAFQRGRELSGVSHFGQGPFLAPAAEPTGPASGGGLLCPSPDLSNPFPALRCNHS